MDEALYGEIIRRLDAEGVDDGVATLVLAAAGGVLDAVLDGVSAETRPGPQEGPIS